MTSKRSTFALLIALGLSAVIQAQPQMPKWCLPPFMVDFTGTAPVTSALPGWTGGTASTEASNAAFDASGNLLFYVVRNKIYDAAGSYVDNIAGNFYDPKETAIFKVPGFCNRYYIVSVGVLLSTAALYYTMVDANASGVTLVPGLQGVNFTGLGWFYQKATFAVSQVRTDGNRLMYVCGFDNIAKYTVTSTGITFNNVIANSSSGMDFMCNELDLNHAGDKLAWGENGLYGPNALVNVIDLDSNGDFISAQTYSITNAGAEVYGVEFNSAGTQLLVSSFDNFANYANEGINNIDLTAAPTSFVHIPGSAAFKASQLELAFDGKVYASSGSNLGSVDPSTNAFNSVAVPISVIFTLPDQIDGQDYQVQTGSPDFWVSDGMDSWSTAPDDGTEPRLNLSWDGDIWNCENNPNCTQNENPEFKVSGDNYMRVKVQNRGCITSLPTTANLHMYWTRGRSGEIWNQHWLDPILSPSNTINGFPAGGEITADQSTAVSIPIDIPAIPSGGFVVLTQAWQPPNPANFSGGPGPVDGNQNPMICFLARIESAIDPMYDEQNGSIGYNVQSNNNIATRNTYVINLDSDNVLHWGGSIDVNPLHQAPSIIRLDFDVARNNEPFQQFGTVSFQLSPNLWETWLASGALGEQVEIVDFEKRIIQLTDPQHASLLNLTVNPDQDYSILPGFQLIPGRPEGEHQFQFRIQMTDENTGESGSANTYTVRIRESCSLNLINQAATTAGACVSIGKELGCSNCTYTWTPTTGLVNPRSAVILACPDQTTTYTLTVQNESTGCEVSDQVKVFVLEGNGNRNDARRPANNISSVNLFPNPTDDLFELQFTAQEAAEMPVVLINNLGQTVLIIPATVQKGDNRLTISGKQLASGIYVLKIGQIHKSIAITH